MNVPTGSKFTPGEFSIPSGGVAFNGATDASLRVTLTPNTTPATAPFELRVDPKADGTPEFTFAAEEGTTTATGSSSEYLMTLTQTGATCNAPTGEFELSEALYDGGGNFTRVAAQFSITCQGSTSPDASGFFWLGRAALGPIGTDGTPDPTATQPPAMGEYIPLTSPVRLLDTRSPASKLTAGGSKDIDTKLAADGGSSGVPATAQAVVVNITGIAPDTWTFLSAYPKGGSRPVVSNLNPREKDTVANLATVQVGADDSITLYNEVGTTDAVVDVVGYYEADDNGTLGNRYEALAAPVRAFDTRTSPNTKLTEGQTLTVDMSSAIPAGSPARAATAAVVNVTVTNPTKGGYVTLFPANVATAPTASTINFTAEQTIANLATVTLDAGKIKVYNPAGTTDVAIDLIGVYRDDDNSNTAGRFVSIAPTRVYDSRNAGSTKIGADASRDVNMLWLADKYPIEYSSVVANATVVDTTELSYLTAYPAASSVPFVSNLNWKAGDVRPNQVVVGTDDDGFTGFYNAKGQTNLVLDVAGFFTR